LTRSLFFPKLVIRGVRQGSSLTVYQPGCRYITWSNKASVFRVSRKDTAAYPSPCGTILATLSCGGAGEIRTLLFVDDVITIPDREQWED
jgi:hypothetical protein